MPKALSVLFGSNPATFYLRSNADHDANVSDKTKTTSGRAAGCKQGARFRLGQLAVKIIA